MGEALADRSDSADDRLALDAERRTASPYEGPGARCVRRGVKKVPKAHASRVRAGGVPPC